MTTAPAPHFGALLKRHRRAAGLTQEALAERAGLSVRGIQDLERGASQSRRPDTVDLLAAALGLSAQDRAALAATARPGSGQTLPLDRPARPAPVSSGSLVPLVGRGRELALLERFLAGEGELAGTAPVPVLLLAGEPGIGKTRLLQAAAQQAVAEGWRVLAGGCHRRGGQEPYAPLLDALARHLQAAPPDRRRAALEGCAWLVRLLPELAADPGVGASLVGALPAEPLAPEQERRLMFAAVARLLANIAGPAGTLLVLDDLQWAGPDALDLLATLVRAGPTPPAPLRVVGAYRDTEVRPDDPLSQVRADLAQAGLLRHHPLGPLAPGDAVELLADLLAGGAAPPPGDPVVVERVLERAGGHALLPGQLRAGAARGPGAGASGGGRGAVGRGAGRAPARGAAAGAGAPAPGRRRDRGPAHPLGAARGGVRAGRGRRAGRAGGGQPGAAVAGGRGRDVHVRARPGPRGGGGRRGRGAARGAAPPDSRGAGGGPGGRVQRLGRGARLPLHARRARGQGAALPGAGRRPGLGAARPRGRCGPLSDGDRAPGGPGAHPGGGARA